MMTPTTRFKFAELKQWFKDYEKYLNSGDYVNAHILANKIAFWSVRLPNYEKESKERLNCNE